ncbi:conserved hypothetical protein [Perkinsus marinus ATCC 50983]|uniref:AB hydrolase-1 domain-containing protein n=1 Tax=Perkinsus marinus (strain ATCC 50983 / TXsc) TaxID=423536 RepID=C5L6W3_PERM5|nr:conserved hypothetical protein [Perkinsus marinus ATCC 50983]EER07225.1 conserved hypothetical protein [Perkinsus marinus ATCC 50983]|eukprot:XP_002775409.1 conserved hypothetical protein [Perkinsus marinus ATCC 50983]
MRIHNKIRTPSLLPERHVLLVHNTLLTVIPCQTISFYNSLHPPTDLLHFEIEGHRPITQLVPVRPLTFYPPRQSGYGVIAPNEDIGYSWISYYYLARHLKVDLIAYDYPGYGLNSGKPSESNTYTTIRAVYDFAISSMGIPPSNIILYGQSIGSGPAVDLYTKVHVGGLILHSAIGSGLRVYKSYERPRRTPWFDLYRNVEKLSDYFAEAGKSPPPIFIIHGTDDEEVPYEHGMLLAETITGDKDRRCAPGTTALYPPWWVKGGTHNDIETRYRDQYYKRLKAYVRYLKMSPRPDLSTLLSST